MTLSFFGWKFLKNFEMEREKNDGRDRSKKKPVEEIRGN
jgi:hypothetical protein